MENKNTGLISIVVILSLLVLGLGGFVISDKVLTGKPIENNDNNEVVNNKDKETATNNSYELFAKNLKSQFSKYDDNNRNYLYVNTDVVKDGYEVYLTKNQTLFLKYFSKELNNKYGEYKIADNVLSFNVVAVGQGGGNMLYFINEDGTVGSADTENGIGTNNQITIKQNIGYKNIVNVISGTFGDGFSGVNGPIFIDINGNIFSENLK